MEGLNKVEKQKLNNEELETIISIMNLVGNKFPLSKEEKDTLKQELNSGTEFDKALLKLGKPVFNKTEVERSRKIINDLFDKLSK